MNTQLKNQWIALEEKYHKLLKEKVNQDNLKNSTSLPFAEISSFLTFCNDGVIIKKHSNPNYKNGISFKVFDKSISEIKKLENSEFESPESRKKNTILIFEFNNDDISLYDPFKMVEKDFSVFTDGK